ncbi:MAG: ribonuclease HII [Alphaproteobacteria bacterium]|nr:ribonuclease HII [Alphaproteobacteria bacterium]
MENSIGIDEVGRGPLAGPVVAAAVWLSEKAVAILEKGDVSVRDSKKLSSRQRSQVVEWVKAQPKSILKYAVAEVSVEEIDSLNILNATLLAMKRAYTFLDFNVSIALIDGNKAPDLENTKTRTVIKGDDKVLAIALASIIAKEYRDDIMKNLSKKYPLYGWDKNVGYGSQQHIYAILQHGVTPHHRKTFSPMKDLASVSDGLKSLVAKMTSVS